MSKVLLLNAGSSSVKWKVFEIENEKMIAEGGVDRLGNPKAVLNVEFNGRKMEYKKPNLGYEDAAKLIIEKIQELNIASLDEITTVGHRVVAGGHFFTKATKITPEVLQKIIDLSDFAPLHNPHEARYVKIMQKIMPNVTQYAVFDSAFFTDMPEMNAIYSLPYELTEKYGIQRYGEHGISHTYLMNRAAELLKRPLKELKMISLHLGSGASVAAIKDGKAFDSSMGFTPLPGLTMGTRAGDVDPSIIPFLMKKENLTSDEVMNILNAKSGLLGISGYSADMRDIRERQLKGDKRSTLARDIFLNRIVKYVGAYYAELGGIDALIISGGIGEHQSDIRLDLIDQLKCLNIHIDKNFNEEQHEGVISSADSTIKTLLIPTNEELEMVKQIKKVL